MFPPESSIVSEWSPYGQMQMQNFFIGEQKHGEQKRREQKTSKY